MQPSESFLIRSLNLIRAWCPVVSPSTATISVLVKYVNIHASFESWGLCKNSSSHDLGNTKKTHLKLLKAVAEWCLVTFATWSFLKNKKNICVTAQSLRHACCHQYVYPQKALQISRELEYLSYTTFYTFPISCVCIIYLYRLVTFLLNGCSRFSLKKVSRLHLGLVVVCHLLTSL